LLPVAPHTAPRAVRGLARDRFAQRRHVLGRANVGDGHREKFIAAVPVGPDGRFVDREKPQRVEIEDPGRERVPLDEESIALFGLLQSVFRGMAPDSISVPYACPVTLTSAATLDARARTCTASGPRRAALGSSSSATPSSSRLSAV